MTAEKPTGRRRRRRPTRRRGRRRPPQGKPARKKAPQPPPSGDLVEGVLERSPADETEIVLLRTRRGVATSRRDGGGATPHEEVTVAVRVLERGRLGTYRTGDTSPSGLDAAIRQAIAQSRSRDTLRGLPHLPSADGSPADGASGGGPATAPSDGAR